MHYPLTGKLWCYYILNTFLGMVYTLYRVKRPVNPHTNLSYKADDRKQAKPMSGFLVEPEIFTHRRRKGKSCRPYMVRHPKMTSVKFGKAKIRVVDDVEVPPNTDQEFHVDTPRPQIFSNQDLVDANLTQAIVYYCNSLYFVICFFRLLLGLVSYFYNFVVTIGHSYGFRLYVGGVKVDRVGQRKTHTYD